MPCKLLDIRILKGCQKHFPLFRKGNERMFAQHSRFRKQHTDMFSDFILIFRVSLIEFNYLVFANRNQRKCSLPLFDIPVEEGICRNFRGYHLITDIPKFWQMSADPLFIHFIAVIQGNSGQADCQKTGIVSPGISRYYRNPSLLLGQSLGFPCLISHF